MKNIYAKLNPEERNKTLLLVTKQNTHNCCVRKYLWIFDITHKNSIHGVWIPPHKL